MLQFNIEDNKLIKINAPGSFIINPTRGHDAMKEVSVIVDIPFHSVPVISKIRISEKETFDYDYSLSSFTKITSEESVTIPSKKTLLFIRIYNTNEYIISEVINTSWKRQNFNFKGASSSKPDYYKIVDDKTIKKDHCIYLLDKNNNIIQYMKIYTNIKDDKNLIKNEIRNYRKYIDISL